MQTQSWTVHVDGAAREVVAATDPESGRTAIRIDGRMAGRPLTPAEEEREFAVGSARYIVRRQPGGELDLDVAAPDFTAQPARRAADDDAPPKRSVVKIIGGIVVTILLLAVARYAREAITYLRVPWQSYTPPDHAFRVSFPGLPEESRETFETGEYEVPHVHLQARHGDHLYTVERLTYPHDIPAPMIEKVTDSIFMTFVEDNEATIIKRGWTGHARRDALRYIVQVPENDEWSKGTAHGLIVVDRRFVFIVYAYVPQGDALSFDVGEFLRSFELP